MHQTSKRNRMIMHFLCVLFACLFGCVSVLLTGSSVPETVQSDYYEDMALQDGGTSVLKTVSLWTKNSTLDGFHVCFEKPDEEEDEEEVDPDPQLYLTFSEGEAVSVRSVELVLEESFLYDVTCVLYYPSESGSYEADATVVVTLPREENSVFFELPEEVDYAVRELRIDIDEDYVIADIRISDQEVIREYTLEKSSLPLRFLITFAVLLLLFEGILYCAPWVMQFAGFCLEKKKELLQLLLMLAGAAVLGNGAAYLAFRLTGKTYSWFWAVLIAFCSAAAVYQIWLLVRPFPVAAQTGREGKITGARILYWAAILVFCLMIVFEWVDGSGEMPEVAGLIRFRFPIAFAILETILLALLYQRYVLNVREEQISFVNISIFIFFLMGLAYLLLFLPFVSPDEPSHYVSAYRVSNLLLGKTGLTEGNRLLVRLEDFALYDMQDDTLSSEYYMQITENFRLFSGVNGYCVIDGEMVTNAIFSYIVPGIGIAIARILHLSGTMTFLTGRLANLLFFTIVLRFLMKKIPYGKTALFALAMMPMTLHMAASYSYDVMTFGFVALFVVQVLCMVASPEKVSARDYRLCVIYGILVAPSKMVYIPLLLLIFLVPWEKLADTRKKAWVKKILAVIIPLAVTCVIMLVISLLNEDSTLRKMAEQSASVNILSWTDEPGYTFSWILGHLGESFLMFVRTLVNMADYYFFTMIGSSLGWLDVAVPQVYAVISFVMLLLAANIRESGEQQPGAGISGKGRLWIAFLCAGCVAATLLVMAVSWTPMSYDYIAGVQGRYFIPLLVPAICLLQTQLVQVKSAMRKYIVFGTGMLNLWVLVYVYAQYIVGT